MTRLVLQLHAGFVLAGMGTTLLGPIIPLLAAAWGLDDREAGRLFAAQFAGALLATSVSALVARRIGEPRALSAGFLLFAAGIGAIGLAPREAAPAAALTFGLGQGLVLPLTNIAIAALYPVRPAGALSLVNVSWGVGAVLWPLVVGVLARPADPSPATGALAAACLISSVAWLFAGYAGRARAAGVSNPDPPPQSVPLKVAVAYGVLLLLYVGTETSIGGWVAELARRAGAPRDTWTLAPAAFWTLQTGGRLLAPLLLRAAPERGVLVGSLVAAGAVTVALVAIQDQSTAIIVAAALAGLAVAPIFPLLWAGITRDVAPSRPSALGPLFAAGGAGGALLPWLVGVASDATSSLALAMLVPCSAIAVMLALVPAAWRGETGTGPSPS